MFNLFEPKKIDGTFGFDFNSSKEEHRKRKENLRMKMKNDGTNGQRSKLVILPLYCTFPKLALVQNLGDEEEVFRLGHSF